MAGAEVPAEASTTPTADAVDGQRRLRLDALNAVLELEAASARPAPGREDQWRQRVLGTLTELRAVLSRHHALLPRDLLADIAADQPRLRRRVQDTRDHYQRVLQRVTALCERLTDPDHAPRHHAEIRDEIAVITRDLRRCRASEADLIYEAYTVDIGVGD